MNSLEHVECDHFEESNSKIHNGMLLLGHTYHMFIFKSSYKCSYMGDFTTGENCYILINVFLYPVNETFWYFSHILFGFVETQILNFWAKKEFATVFKISQNSSLFDVYCQAQPRLQPNLWLRLVLFLDNYT